MHRSDGTAGVTETAEAQITSYAQPLLLGAAQRLAAVLLGLELVVTIV